MKTLNDTTLGRAVGQLLIGGFEGLDIPEKLTRLVGEGTLGGVILFSRNIASLHQVAGLVRQLVSLPSPSPLCLAVDQEGGRVQRLKTPFPELPPMRRFGEARKKRLALRAGEILGHSLRMIGFHQNYAPVLDVDSNPANPVIGDRSFGREPALVSRLGAAFIEGLQSAGVAACGKHFPGHGDTSTDSHFELPVLHHDQARLMEVELEPFRAAVRADVAAIMTAHILFPALDPTHPATLSDVILRPLLREELQYDGVVVSDDLEMKAIADHYGIEDAAVRSVRAGCDQLLICHKLDLVERAHAALVRAVEAGELSEHRVFEAAARVKRMKERYVSSTPLVSPEQAIAGLPIADRQKLLDVLEGRAEDDPDTLAEPSEHIVELDLDDQGAEALALDRS